MTTSAIAPADGPRLPVRRKTSVASRWATGSMVASLLIISAAVLLPVAIIVLTAFKPAAEINAYPPTLSPGHWTLANFSRIFTDLPFGRLVFNSVVFAGGVTVFALVFDSLAAYALARIDFRGSKVLLVAIVASLMIPFQATLIPIFQIVSHLGWVDNFAGLIAPRAADAFGIFFLRQFLISLPRDLDNAARIDGASEWRIFRSIVLPNALPAVMILGVFTFVNNWNDLLWPLVFTTSARMGTITSGLTLLTGPSGIVPYGVMMAGSLVAIVPLAILFIFVQRRLVESVASTGLK